MTVTTADRIVGCLKGIATGDAIGKQTEMLSREDVLRWYPQAIRGFDGGRATSASAFQADRKRQDLMHQATSAKLPP